MEGRLAQARLPWLKTLEQFDLSFQPSIDRKVVRDLSALGFVGRAQNVVLLGPPGVGKTHLAIGLAIKAAEVGHRVLFLTLEERMVKLKRGGGQENRLERLLLQLAYPKVLVLDEIGYLPLPREDASLLLRLVARRYEKASMILTSNKSFVDWGDIFSDAVLATAILERLLHHATTINIKGESYRLKTKRKAGMLSAPVKEEDGKAAGVATRIRVPYMPKMGPLNAQKMGHLIVPNMGLLSAPLTKERFLTPDELARLGRGGAGRSAARLRQSMGVPR